MLMLSKNKAPIQLLETLYILTVLKTILLQKTVLLQKMGIDAINISYGGS